MLPTTASRPGERPARLRAAGGPGRSAPARARPPRPRGRRGCVARARSRRWRDAAAGERGDARGALRRRGLSQGRRHVAAIEGRWKLVFRDEDGPREPCFAYDLAEDPAELRALWATVGGTPLEARLRGARDDASAGESGEAAAPDAALRRQLDGLGDAQPGEGR